ncbi:MAG: HD domain-containing phosphohydrolase [Chloroherpetonaceae bacterium]|nr:HD domain-containing protein [Chthonomonadaceae bacterium]MDW8209260.1 HD domain-containing phosphohydrolase [Chloroherpetonaceae bacterium]
MILLPAAELTEGMVVGREVRDRNNQLVIPRGAIINAQNLRVLQRMDVLVYVLEEGEVMEEPAPATTGPKDNASTPLRATFLRATSAFQRHMEIRNISIKPAEVDEIAHTLLTDLQEHPGRVDLLLQIHAWNERFFQHAINTAILAAVLARQIHKNEAQGRIMALGMTFHDCGTLLLPHEIFEKQGKLTDEERKIAARHPLVGYLHVKENGILPQEAAEIVYQHHERPDGKGYPQGLTEAHITPLARIAAVVEAFDAMTSLRSYARGSTPEEAMKTILSQTGKAYDREAALALMQHITLYPAGTAVRLNTGECGLVTATNPGCPTRPVVRIFFGSDGRRVPATEINLATDPARMIVQSAPMLDELRDVA